MLPDAPEVELVLLGPNGVLEGAAPGSVVIDMTTNNPEDSVRLATRLHDKHVAMLDAPVSGGDVGARNGTLSIIPDFRKLKLTHNGAKVPDESTEIRKVHCEVFFPLPLATAESHCTALLGSSAQLFEPLQR